MYKIKTAIIYTGNTFAGFNNILPLVIKKSLISI